MAKDSKIEWCDHTLNFWWGCHKVGRGCFNCYAQQWAERTGHPGLWGPPRTTTRWRTKGPWRDVLKWDAQAGRDGVRRRVFCQSMSDFFEDHPQVNAWREEAWPILAGLSNLDVLLLTKRPENVFRFLMTEEYVLHGLPRHVWVGTSAEDQDSLDARWGILDGETHHMHPSVLFLSLEPLLGPVDLEGELQEIDCGDEEHSWWTRSPDWIIVGGESGPRARPFDLGWAESIVAQCREYEVPVFVKQIGDNPVQDGVRYIPPSGKLSSKGGDPEEWPAGLRVREFPDVG